MLWALGQRTEAGRAFEAAAALDPQARYAWQNLCQAAMAAGRTRSHAYCRTRRQLRKRGDERPTMRADAIGLAPRR